MGIAAALYSRTIGQVADGVAKFQAGRQEAKDGVRAAAELSARAAASPTRDALSSAVTPHAPDSRVRPNARLQAPKATPNRTMGVNAAGSQRPSLRLAQELPKSDGDAEV